MIAHLIRRVGCVGRPRWAVLCFYLTLIKTELGNPSSTLKKSTVLTHTTLVAVDNMKISSIGTSSLSLTLPVVVLFIATFTGQMKKKRYYHYDVLFLVACICYLSTTWRETGTLL